MLVSFSIQDSQTTVIKALLILSFLQGMHMREEGSVEDRRAFDLEELQVTAIVASMEFGQMFIHYLIRHFSLQACTFCMLGQCEMWTAASAWRDVVSSRRPRPSRCC